MMHHSWKQQYSELGIRRRGLACGLLKASFRHHDGTLDHSFQNTENTITSIFYKIFTQIRCFFADFSTNIPMMETKNHQCVARYELKFRCSPRGGTTGSMLVYTTKPATPKQRVSTHVLKIYFWKSMAWLKLTQFRQNSPRKHWTVTLDTIKRLL